MKEKGYTFPSLSYHTDDSVMLRLGIRVMPVALIFDKNSKLIFRGNPYKAIQYFDKLMEKEKLR